MSDLRDKRQRDYESLVERMGLKVKMGEADVPDPVSVPIVLPNPDPDTVATSPVRDPPASSLNTSTSPLPSIKKSKSTSPSVVQRHSFYRKLSGLDNPGILDDKAAEAEASSPTARYITQTKVRFTRKGWGRGRGRETRFSVLSLLSLASSFQLLASSRYSPKSNHILYPQELNIIPNTIISSVIESVDKNGCVELGSSSLGDDMAVALSHSISVMFVVTMNVSYNHITDRGVGALLGSLDPHVITELNLAFVKMKKKPIEVLSELIGETSTLEKLIMEKVSWLCVCSGSAVLSLPSPPFNAPIPPTPHSHLANLHRSATWTTPP